MATVRGWIAKSRAVSYSICIREAPIKRGKRLASATIWIVSCSVLVIILSLGRPTHFNLTFVC